MKLESIATILDFDPYSQRTEEGATHNVGEGVSLADQRKFRYARAGEALTLGYLAVAPTPNTDLHTLAVLTGAIGSQTITFTNAATTTIDTVAETIYYSEGYVCVVYSTGIGQTWKINTLDPVATGAAGTIHLYDVIGTALATTSKIDIVQNTYNGSIMDVLVGNLPAGVPLKSITAAGDFGWLQTRGVCALASDDTIAAATDIVADGNDAGKVDGISETIGTTVAQHKVGKTIVAGADTYSHAVFLMIE